MVLRLLAQLSSVYHTVTLERLQVRTCVTSRDAMVAFVAAVAAALCVDVAAGCGFRQNAAGVPC